MQYKSTIHNTHNTHNKHNTHSITNTIQDLHSVLHWQYIIQHNSMHYSKHNTQYTHSKHNIMDGKTKYNKNTMQGLFTQQNALAVVRMQCKAYTAHYTGSSTNKIRNLQYITHEETIQYLHTTHTAQ